MFASFKANNVKKKFVAKIEMKKTTKKCVNMMLTR